MHHDGEVHPSGIVDVLIGADALHEQVPVFIPAEYLQIEFRSLPEQDADEYCPEGDKPSGYVRITDLQIDLADHVDVDQGKEYPVGIFNHLDITEDIVGRLGVDEDKERRRQGHGKGPQINKGFAPPRLKCAAEHIVLLKAVRHDHNGNGADYVVDCRQSLIIAPWRQKVGLTDEDEKKSKGDTGPDTSVANAEVKTDNPGKKPENDLDDRYRCQVCE